MKIYCSEADCDGNDKNAGHYSNEELFLRLLKENNLAKDSAAGDTLLWVGSGYATIKQYEDIVKLETKEKALANESNKG